MSGVATLTWEQAVKSLRDDPGSKDLVRASFFDDPLIDAARRYYESSEWMAVRLLLPPPSGHILDVGAGRGIATFALAADGWQVTALEPSPSAIVGAGAIRALASETRLPVTVVQEWGENLPFDDESFDAIHARQVLHHAKDLRQLCRELGRVLRPGGVLLATREHVISRLEDLPKFLESHPLHKLYGGENAYLLRDYISAIEAGGIRIRKVFNRLDSNINLYPSTTGEVKARWARRFHLHSPDLVPDGVLSFLGAFSQHPGRLYTFVGAKN